MDIALALNKEKQQILKYDSHILSKRLVECIDNQLVYVLKDEGNIVGVMRYSLFWQCIPFLDLIYIDEQYRGKGYGVKMMGYWEKTMISMGFEHVMLSTQEDETAKFFYEKIGYHHIGGFFPPNQDVNELMYLKKIKN